jgi:ATP:ADP antiporter, AAA family
VFRGQVERIPPESQHWQLLWLPTSREEKYKAKQAVDSFFVRLGGLAAAFVVFAGTTWPAFGARGFAAPNLVLVEVWLGVAIVLVRENRRLSAAARQVETGGR